MTYSVADTGQSLILRHSRCVLIYDPAMDCFLSKEIVSCISVRPLDSETSYSESS